MNEAKEHQLNASIALGKLYKGPIWIKDSKNAVIRFHDDYVRWLESELYSKILLEELRVKFIDVFDKDDA